MAYGVDELHDGRVEGVVWWDFDLEKPSSGVVGRVGRTEQERAPVEEVRVRDGGEMCENARCIGWGGGRRGGGMEGGELV